MKLHFALDYDGTYSEAPELFDKFIDLALAKGHQVTCVTMRYDNSQERIEMPIPIIYTDRKAKVPYCQSIGVKIDIWIDDSPHWLLEDSR